MSKFTEEDWAGLANGGNEVFNREYLARLNPREHPSHNSTDINKLKDFIRQKYIDKKWHADGGQPHSGSFVGTPASTTSAQSAPEEHGKISIKLGSRPVSSLSVSFAFFVCF